MRNHPEHDTRVYSSSPEASARKSHICTPASALFLDRHTLFGDHPAGLSLISATARRMTSFWWSPAAPCLAKPWSLATATCPNLVHQFRADGFAWLCGTLARQQDLGDKDQQQITGSMLFSQKLGEAMGSPSGYELNMVMQCRSKAAIGVKPCVSIGTILRFGSRLLFHAQGCESFLRKWHAAW